MSFSGIKVCFVGMELLVLAYTRSNFWQNEIWRSPLFLKLSGILIQPSKDEIWKTRFLENCIQKLVSRVQIFQHFHIRNSKGLKFLLKIAVAKKLWTQWDLFLRNNKIMYFARRIFQFLYNINYSNTNLFWSQLISILFLT